MTEIEKAKRKFRATKEWKNFRMKMKRLSKNRCCLTGTLLRKGFQVHHLDLNPEHYEDLNEENFVCLNKRSHELVHTIFIYWMKDKGIIDRLVKILEKMEELTNVNFNCRT